MTTPNASRGAGRLRRLGVALGIAALLAGAVAWWLRAPPANAPVPALDATPIPQAARESGTDQFGPNVTGGVYGGTVVDKDDKPIPSADVWLVATADHEVQIASPIVSPALPGGPDTTPMISVKVIGQFDTVAQVKTDGDGRFRASAGAARVVALFAAERAHAPGILASTQEEPLKPAIDHVIRLPDAGRLEGTVIDAKTRAPVMGADVRIYLQSRANQEAPGPEPFTARNAFAKFQEYVARALGPAIWGVTAIPGDAGMPLVTAADGTFSFGPLMSEVQVEVVITHPDYMWTEFDPDVQFEKDNPKPGEAGFKPGNAPLARVRRVAVKPGETVKRTYELQTGQEVRGRVLDDTGAAIEDAAISLEHVAQYHQHPRFRTHGREARTDSQGKFRIAGLSYGPYNLRMTHPSFDTEWFHGVKASAGGADPVEFRIPAAGWIEAEVAGGPEDRPVYQALFSLQREASRESEQRSTVNVAERRFTVQKAKPGRYRAWIQTGPYVSESVAIEVEPRRVTSLSLVLATGGVAEIPVTDRFHLPVDPATIDLEAVAPDGSTRNAGRMTSREGLARVTALRPGRYRARVRSLNFVDAVSEPFDVAGEKTTRVEPVILHKSSYVRIVGVTDDQGRLPKADATLEVAEGDGEYVPRKALEAGLLQVRPGKVRIRVKSEDGLSFEQIYDVDEAGITPVDVVLRK